MIESKNVTDYWFTIEPYVYVGLTDKYVLLYNTLDSAIVESKKKEVIELLQETLQKENHGVLLLRKERYQSKITNAFIRELREKYMGDIIDITLSKSKPVQLLPFFNFSNSNNFETYKKHNFPSNENVLKNLFEISIYVNKETQINTLIPFLQSAPDKMTFNINGNIKEVIGYEKMLSFFDQHLSPKNVICSCENFMVLQPNYKNNFSYTISVNFPIDFYKFSNLFEELSNQYLPFKYIFDVSSLEDCQQAELLIERFHVKQYQLRPVYTGRNITFFEKNIFLSKEDILSASISIRDIFAHQALNSYDFGKINIMPNGDIYANLNHPVLGNIHIDSLHEIVCRELETGLSWLRIRNQAPCNNCVYQWLCPSPSNYEIDIDRLNLCHVNCKQ